MSIITQSYNIFMGNLKSVVGDNIRKLRRERGWTQSFVAESVGVTAPFLTMIESGQRGMSIDFLESISELFDVPPAALFSQTDKNKNTDRNQNLEILKKRLTLKIDKIIDETVKEFE